MSELIEFLTLAFAAAFIAVGFVVGICVLFREEIIEELQAFREEESHKIMQ
jgi:hypothetical protein